MSKFKRLVGLVIVLANLLSTTAAVLPEGVLPEPTETTVSTETPSETTGETEPEKTEPEKTEPETSETEETSAPEEPTEKTTESSSETSSETTEETAESTEPEETTSETTESTAQETGDKDDKGSYANEQTTLTYEGDTYKVTAVYGPETCIPSDCELSVKEISKGDVYNEYKDLTQEALENKKISKVRFFDICLVKDGKEFEPKEGTSVSVKITLKEALKNEVSVVHISDDSEAKVVNDLDVKNASNGTEVSFNAGEFSAYAIVEGPVAPEDETVWHRITSLDELYEHRNEIFFGNPNGGYYLTNEMYNVNSTTRTGIKKIQTGQTPRPSQGAAAYVFESVGTNQYRIYTVDEGTNKYIRQSGNSLSLVTNVSQATTFTISDFPDNANTFRALGTNGFYINQQGGASGNGFCAYNNETDVNAKLGMWYRDDNTPHVDPYGLDGVTKGLMYYTTGVNGRGLMAESSNTNYLDALTMPVLTKEDNHNQKIFVPNDTDLDMWTFEWVSEDRYYISTKVNGVTMYLNVDSSGVSVSTVRHPLRVVPGTGANSGKISIVSGTRAAAYSGVAELGFGSTSTTSTSSEKWLSLVDITELSSDYVLPYSARKISASSDEIKNGTKVIIYTRVWDNDQKKYRFYAIDHDGTLYECFEDGDEIQWIDDRINTLLWDFTVYYNEDAEHTQENENYYYELFNEYSEKYIVPNAGNSNALGNSKIGINLNGRREGNYSTTIIAWDDRNYAYAGIKTDPDTMKIVSYPVNENVDTDESVDFYFAIVQDAPIEDELHTVKTIDHTKYGINMKIIDFNMNNQNWMQSEQSVFLGSTSGGAGADPTQGILSNSLDPATGYPTVTSGTHIGESLKNLYDPSRLRTVNNLFIESTYNTSGYFVFDSTQNYAYLPDGATDFTVYQELGSVDGSTRPSLQHGQFLPFNNITAGSFSNSNPQNLYNALQQELSNNNPRKYEQLHKVDNPNYQFGVELSTTFVQTPNGLDDWGHDIIYEFTGDDDFWLYVDGELVIDLGGVHSALYGSINYATGEVKVQTRGRNGAPQPGDIKTYLLFDIFHDNYIARGMTEEQAQTELAKRFDMDTKLFKDYTSHEMKIFYMERGGGASNVQMRFNQSSVRPKTVILEKELTGVENVKKFEAEFPYQIYYQLPDESTYRRLSNTDEYVSVHYRGTNTAVKYEQEYVIDGYPYNDVFFLKPGEACEIEIPDEAINYYIVECGVDPDVYDAIKANDDDLTQLGQKPQGAPSTFTRKDYSITPASAKERTSVHYENHVDQSKLRTLTFTKKLWDEGGLSGNELLDDDTPFSFRLYLATEHETTLTLANMYTYHVKDPDGNYCRWDADSQKFVKLRDGATDYSAFTAEEKRQISFTTSMNGAISKIPSNYTVEVRELLAGTKYKVQERYDEIPDGYSRINYWIYDDVTDTSDYDPEDDDANTQRTILNGKDPHVVINNIKGFGIRMYKEWTDADYVSERVAAYFAVYVKRGSGSELVLDPDSIYQLKYNKNSLYWYYESLEAGLSLDDYQIREVKITDPVVDTTTGKVTSYGTITPVTGASGDNTIDISGKLKGDTISSAFTYTVIYDTDPQYPSSNMRVETIVNKRDGLKIYKTDNSGNPLEGAKFELRDDTNALVGTFESDSEGYVTMAYLRKNVDYTLKEIKSPSGYTALKSPLTVRLNNDGTYTVTAASADSGRFVLDEGATGPSLTVKNLNYELTAIKTDSITGQPVAGAVFALHKQKKVGGVTLIDFQPLAGYEHLETGIDGIIPKIDNTLAPGTYELREVTAPDTHLKLDHHILFTVTETGVVKLNKDYSDAAVTEETENGTVTYTMTVNNTPVQGDLMISKRVDGNLGNKFKKFTFEVILTDSYDQPYVGTFTTKLNGGTEVEHTLTAADQGLITIELRHGDTIIFDGLADGTKYTVTESECGYLRRVYLDGSLVSENGTAAGNTADNNSVLFVNIREVLIPTGVNASFTSALAVLTLIGLGLAVNLVLTGKRRREEICAAKNASGRNVRKPSSRDLDKLKGLFS